LLISIVMPLKNEAKFLARCLDSICQQSEKNFELLAVDDYSVDNSLEILKQYSLKDSRIKYFSNKNHGVLAALELAYSHSKGELVTRMDADDVMPVCKLEELKRILIDQGLKTCATGLVEYFSDDDLAQGFINYANWLNSLCVADTHLSQLYKECVVASPNWMAYKTDLLAINAFVDNKYPEDYYLLFRMLEHGMKIVSSKKTTHLWRDHPIRASRVSEHYADNKFYSVKLEFFEKFEGFKNIVLWGAGPSGKKLAKDLIDLNVSFKWIAQNNNKIGQQIYGVEIQPIEILKDHLDHKLIITVTQKGAMTEISNYLKEINFPYYFEF
jgi:glycosyltransferase involved in cell wall biosynthesis